METNNIFFDYSPDLYIKKIQNKEYFSYSRFNDGELIAAIKQTDIGKSLQTEKNCDNHKYFPEMGKELLESLKYGNDKNYIIQYLWGWIRNNQFNQYTEFLIQNKFITGSYQKSDFLQHMLRYEPEKFKIFINEIKKYDIVFVGPSYTSEITFLGKYKHIQIPQVNCYLEKKSIINNIEKEITGNQMILFAASMTTNVLIMELFQKYGNDNFMIDIGSLFDIFFLDKNKSIKQRTDNLTMIESIRVNYEEYFIK